MAQSTTTAPLERKIIYDLGANNGDDIPYYLLKCDVVTAVEANPALCEGIRTRFKDEIGSGRLIVENCVLTVEEASRQVAFYLHKDNHVLSQFPKPERSEESHFEEIYLPSKNVVELIKQHGEPYFIKIDLEGYDHCIIKSLFSNNIFPPYISAESHSLDVFCLLVSSGNYKTFKLVDGNTVSKQYCDRQIRTSDGVRRYSFPHHSAGPFGNDIDGRWMPAPLFFRYLCAVGLGWKDIHASRIDPAASYKVGKLAEVISTFLIWAGRRLRSQPLFSLGQRAWY